VESLIILIPLSVILVAGAMAFFLWAVDSGQYDQLDRDANDALDGGDPVGSSSSRNTTEEPSCTP
jgi:cbb3-type cytochrome oxidase maturation protein